MLTTAHIHIYTHRLSALDIAQYSACHRMISSDEEGVECGTCLIDLMLSHGNIHQCPEGHLQCAECFVRIGGAEAQCPACGASMNNIRNRYMEKQRAVRRSPQAAHRDSLSSLPGSLQEQVLQLIQEHEAQTAMEQSRGEEAGHSPAVEQGARMKQEAEGMAAVAATTPARRREEHADAESQKSMTREKNRPAASRKREVKAQKQPLDARAGANERRSRGRSAPAARLQDAQRQQQHAQHERRSTFFWCSILISVLVAAMSMLASDDVEARVGGRRPVAGPKDRESSTAAAVDKAARKEVTTTATSATAASTTATRISSNTLLNTASTPTKLTADLSSILAAQSSSWREASKLLEAAGGIPAVVSAMGEHPKEVEVQVLGCMALGNFASCQADDPQAAAQTVVKAGGIAAIVEAMRSHENVTKVQQAGCDALIKIASDSRPHRRAIAKVCVSAPLCVHARARVCCKVRRRRIR